MINLLPNDTKKQLRAARTNVILYRYCLLLIVTAVLLGGVFALGFVATANSRSLAENTKKQAEADAQQFSSTRTSAVEFANNLAAAKNILASNVSFTKLVLDIAGIIPSGVILNNLSLGTNVKANSPIDISGRASSYASAVALKNSLEDSPIFEKVNIVNISQADLSTQVSDLVKKYPFSVNLKAQFTQTSSKGTK